MWDDNKSSIHVIRVSERMQKEYSAEKILQEIMVGNFSNFVKYIKLQILEVQQNPNRIKTKTIHAQIYQN